MEGQEASDARDRGGQAGLFGFVSLQDRVPTEHPLRVMRTLVDWSLSSLHATLTQPNERVTRRSIPLEQLLCASLLQVLLSIRREWLPAEQLDYNLLSRWFVALSIEVRVSYLSTFFKNRDRLSADELAAAFLVRFVAQARAVELLLWEHFSVEGTLIQAWDSRKNFQPKGRLNADAPSVWMTW